MAIAMKSRRTGPIIGSRKLATGVRVRGQVRNRILGESLRGNVHAIEVD